MRWKRGEGKGKREGRERKDGLRAACRQACTNALPRIWEPRITTCARIRGADYREKRRKC